jgi:hypothetical protein
MPLPSTMTPIATNTLSATASSITIGNLPQNYTDLFIVVSPIATSQLNVRVRVNSDIGSNYSYTYLVGSGSATESSRSSNSDSVDTGTVPTGQPMTMSFNLLNYSNSTTYKTIINRSSSASNTVGIFCALWRNTAAINSITFNTTTSTFAAGSIFTIYGIKAA